MIFAEFSLCQTNMKGQVKCCFPRHIIAAIEKSARILRRKRDCPGLWTLGCRICLHSQALWESWTSLLRVPGVEKGQLACSNPCHGSGKSVTEPRSQLCICTAQHIHQSLVLLVVLQTLSLTVLRAIKMPQAWPFFCISLTCQQAGLPRPCFWWRQQRFHPLGPPGHLSESGSDLSFSHLFSCQYQLQIWIIFIFITPPPSFHPQCIFL